MVSSFSPCTRGGYLQQASKNVKDNGFYCSEQGRWSRGGELLNPLQQVLTTTIGGATATLSATPVACHCMPTLQPWSYALPTASQSWHPPSVSTSTQAACLPQAVANRSLQGQRYTAAGCSCRIFGQTSGSILGGVVLQHCLMTSSSSWEGGVPGGGRMIRDGGGREAGRQHLG